MFNFREKNLNLDLSNPSRHRRIPLHQATCGILINPPSNKTVKKMSAIIHRYSKTAGLWYTRDFINYEIK